MGLPIPGCKCADIPLFRSMWTVESFKNSEPESLHGKDTF